MVQNGCWLRKSEVRLGQSDHWLITAQLLYNNSSVPKFSYHYWSNPSCNILESMPEWGGAKDLKWTGQYAQWDDEKDYSVTSSLNVPVTLSSETEIILIFLETALVWAAVRSLSTTVHYLSATMHHDYTDNAHLTAAIQMIAGAGHQMNLQSSFYKPKTSLLQTGHTCSVMHASKGLAMSTISPDNKCKTTDMVANMEVRKQNHFVLKWHISSGLN